MENYRKAVLVALSGLVSFASLAAYDNYSQQGGNMAPGQNNSYNQQGSSQGGFQGQQRNYYQGDSGQQNYGDNRSQFQSNPNDNSNEAVAARVSNALQKDPSTPHNIQVTAFDGTITLTGTVRSEDEKNEVETIAKQVSGVKNVSNKVNVRK